jgi:hypothetical protein
MRELSATIPKFEAKARKAKQSHGIKAHEEHGKELSFRVLRELLFRGWKLRSIEPQFHESIQKVPHLEALRLRSPG